MATLEPMSEAIYSGVVGRALAVTTIGGSKDLSRGKVVLRAVSSRAKRCSLTAAAETERVKDVAESTVSESTALFAKHVCMAAAERFSTLSTTRCLEDARR